MLTYLVMSSTKETGSSNGNWTRGDVQVDRFKSYEFLGSIDALHQSPTSLFFYNHDDIVNAILRLMASVCILGR
jgi:hypothetical protein